MINKWSILFVLLTWSCNSTLEDPSVVDPESMLQLTSSQSVIPSGGTGKTIVIARVPREAGVLDISFTTTAGKFPQTDDNAIKDQTDSLVNEYRYASATLVSDNTQGTVYLTAEVKDSRKRIAIVFN